MKYYVYHIINLINGKMYIGKSSINYNRLQDHIRVSNDLNTYKYRIYPINLAIHKYGIDNFSYRVIQYFDLEKDAFLAEIYWISYYKTNINKYGKEFGYNLTDGGEGISGFKLTKIQRENLSKSRKGKGVGTQNPMYGKSLSDEHKLKISIANKGNICSAETRLKISEANLGENHPMFGKTHSPEAKEKISKANKENYEKTHSQESRHKRSKKMLGELNSSAKLTESQVIEIKEKLRNKQSCASIAREYGRHPATIQDIKSGRRWKNV